MENNNGEEKVKRENGEDVRVKMDDTGEVKDGKKLATLKMVWQRIKKAFIKFYHVCKSLGGLIFLLALFNVLGALLFLSIEAPEELKVKEDMNNTRNEFLAKFHIEARNYWVNPTTYNKTWINRTLTLMQAYEKEVRARGNVAGPETVWNFWSALFFCGTIYTTIGYGNIVPLTGIGKFLSMVYAVLGIPLALLVLAEVGRRFTVLLKMIYGAVRRYYYTGSFRRRVVKSFRNRISRKNKANLHTVEVGTINEGMEQPTLKARSKSEESIIFVKHKHGLSTSPQSSLKSRSNSMDSIDIIPVDHDTTLTGSDKVKILYDIEIDDSFNLPMSVASVILIIYILLGGIMYLLWEDWNYLESVYFVFISISTIGFGDIAPAHPKYFIISSVYMFMGLALVSMCVNVGIEFFTQTIDKAKAHMDKAKDRVVVAGRVKMASVGKEMNKAKDRVSKAGNSAKDRIVVVKKNIGMNIQNELKRAKKHSLDSSESRSKESTPKLTSDV